MTPKDRAQKAQFLLDDPLLNEVMDRLEAASIERLLTLTKADQDADRLAEIYRANCIRDIRGAFRSVLAVDMEAKRSPPVIA